MKATTSHTGGKFLSSGQPLRYESVSVVPIFIISPLSNLLQYHHLFILVSCLVLYTCSWNFFASSPPPPLLLLSWAKSLSHRIFVLCHRSRAYGNLYCMGGNPFHCYFFNIKAAAWLEEVFCPVNFFSAVQYYIILYRLLYKYMHMQLVKES